jgi:NAD(P)-dependent dehydrogenase (short-subunit alcohol dehydrogenase family)
MYAHDPGGCIPEILVTGGAAERRVPTRLVRPTMEIGQLFSLAGRRVLITGGTAGIGLGVAEHFTAAEAHVVITGRRADGDRVAESVGARFVRMDLTEPASITGGLEEGADLLGGGLDTLILNAGVDLEVGPIDALDMAAFRMVFEVNVFGLAQGLSDGLRHMTKGSTIIVTSSPAGMRAAPGFIEYSASKAAVNMIVRSAAIELGPRGIRVNAVTPGIVQTEMAPEDVGVIRVLTASGIVRQPLEMGGVFQFLATEASAPLTGAIVQADDGISAGYSVEVMNRASPD